MRRALQHLPPPIEALAIGASAGGIDALITLFSGLEPPWRAPVIVVLHLPEDHDSQLAGMFARRLGIHAVEAAPGAPAEPGHFYVAPPGYHLLVEAGRTFSLSCEAPVQFSRPSIDVLMESCADAYGESLAGLVLTGANEDGAEGLAAIRAAGGLALAQDPDEAAQPAMPQAAIARANPHAVLPLAELRPLLEKLLRP
ncbi:chemotaxis protein CheB [Ramlibacter humi]|uniref:protein-glutamate methylesterase n=1 Tax=Ramlibacter humi TaxID=2530451 RepID=A0A4Z0BGZ0_9BURK|nr:chemotaxis protein CheB [Ramlibacter humi]TFY97649.1 chemotaxis protein CheB [Ramlibacter humi]